ncbi:hypothetical protein BGX21_004602 [Mortierella sp. AD011]|nr:hypothetical protein BGX20_006656 [Mortierella sp. AD010]KAF9372969.1 hypothetical protein BGX21_004602 [Mortierella sp. AD011]
MSSNVETYVDSDDIEAILGVDGDDMELNVDETEVRKRFFKVTSKPEQLRVVEHIMKSEDCILIAGCGASAYRPVFMSPEVVLSSKCIISLWDNDAWRDRILAVVVDEAHCIDTWGEKFRTDYGDLDKLRSTVPYQVAFIALSVTIPPRILNKVKIKLFRDKPVDIINLGNDRRNIKFKVKYLQHARKSLNDLKFLLYCIKAIVYFDSRAEADETCKYLRSLAKPGQEDKFAVYHSIKSVKRKQEIMARCRGSRHASYSQVQAKDIVQSTSPTLFVCSRFSSHKYEPMNKAQMKCHNNALNSHPKIPSTSPRIKSLPQPCTQTRTYPV